MLIVLIFTALAYISTLIFSVIASIDFYSGFSTNVGSYIGGVLSLMGGVTGAFGAYFIARTQLTKQFAFQSDLQEKQLIMQNKAQSELQEKQLIMQSKTDRERILLEMKIANGESLLENLLLTKMKFYEVHGAYTGFLIDYTTFMQNKLYDKINYDELQNEDLISALSENKDTFINQHKKVLNYALYFPEIVKDYEEERKQTFDEITLGIVEVASTFAGNRIPHLSHAYNKSNLDYPICETYKELLDSVYIELNIVKKAFIKAEKDIENLIEETTTILKQQIEEFKK